MDECQECGCTLENKQYSNVSTSNELLAENYTGYKEENYVVKGVCSGCGSNNYNFLSLVYQDGEYHNG